jgi:hypothetical protein
MALARKIVGGIMVLIGSIWFLQGNNVLPGSFMTGSTFWAITGGIVLLAGLALLTLFNPKPPRA